MIEHVTKKIDAQAFNKIVEAQSKILELPTDKNVAQFYAKSLSSIPGVIACRVCLGHTFSQNGDIDVAPCNDCDCSRLNDQETAQVPKETQCTLDTIPGSYVLPIETLDHRFGFFIFLLEQEDLFEPYKPSIKNLGIFLALSLENRLQKISLQNDRDALLENEKRYKQLLSEQKTAEQERRAHLHFLKSMSSTSRAIHGSNDLEKMMTDVLDVMLSRFDCDRAWLVYPCDPNAASWQAPMERTKPEYPGVSVLGLETPMNAVVREIHKDVLASSGPV